MRSSANYRCYISGSHGFSNTAQPMQSIAKWMPWDDRRIPVGKQHRLKYLFKLPKFNLIKWWEKN